MKAKLAVEDEGRVAEWEIGHSLLAGLIGYDSPCRLRTIQLIHESIDAVERVISDLSELAEADSAEITKALMAHPDPAVRWRAAQSEVGSRAGKMRLKADDDVEVHNAARDG